MLSIRKSLIIAWIVLALSVLLRWGNGSVAGQQIPSQSQVNQVQITEIYKTH